MDQAGFAKPVKGLHPLELQAVQKASRPGTNIEGANVGLPQIQNVEVPQSWTRSAQGGFAPLS